ncbi:MAG: phosphoribosylformylglycinamidine synthase [Acidobacteriota bacterium]|nr:MAG: phosphoribosylformylglycinamidine synthase [Acidobacteriota bacterium]
MVTRIEIGTRPGQTDSRGLAAARRIREHLGIAIRGVRTRDVYHVEPALSEAQSRCVAEAFAGPVLQQGAIGRIDDGPFDVAVSVGYRPGVTDPIGKSARVAIEDLLGLAHDETRTVYTSRLYLLTGVDRKAGERIASELLANEIIERISVQSYEQWCASDPDLTVPHVIETAEPPVETIDLELDDAALGELSRDRLLALSLDEMRAVRDFFRRAGDDGRRRTEGLSGQPTDVELECLAQTWSEHCKHKIFNATIHYSESGGTTETIHSLFKTYIRGTTETLDRQMREQTGSSWLVSVFHDNAGVVAATDRHHLVFKVETHNSPSALDPYGGAITGIVGVNRDPFGTGLGSELLANVWGYCFAPPDIERELPPGLLHPRRIRDGVHHGVIDGGNQSGIPYGRGFEIFEPRYLGKPLVYCGTVARMPVTVTGRAGHEKHPRSGDRIVMVGGRIGKDGIHGATFSSAELTEESPIQAVQIGDPITQKMMFDFLIEARDLGLYSAITDNGAGGLSSSVGEMAEMPGGARLELSRAPLKYHGLAPWEIFLSEAQERMTVAVPPDKIDAFIELARRREVEATDLGQFTDDGQLHVTHGEKTVACLPLAFLHDGLPEMHVEAVWSAPRAQRFRRSEPPIDPLAGAELAARFLARHNLASSEVLHRHYDHEVKGLTVVKPWIGVHRDVPADASVFQIDHESWVGYALAEGIFPTYSDIDAHAMAQAAVDLAVRRLIGAGARADRIAALDNFCWPDPLPGPGKPDALHKAAQLVRACRGLSEACLAYGVPLISGKDSMKNDAVIAGERISIPPTLLVSAIGLVEDVRRAMTLETGSRDGLLVLLGETRDELGASEWAEHVAQQPSSVPRCEPLAWAERYRLVAAAIGDGLVRAAHAPGRGGLLPALFRVARAADAGLDVDLAKLPAEAETGWEARLFGESCGRLLLVIDRSQEATWRRRLAGQPVEVIGELNSSGRFVIRDGESALVRATLDALTAAWKRGCSKPATNDGARAEEKGERR